MLTLDKGEDTDEVNTDVDTFVDTCTPSSSHPAVFNLSHLSHDSHHITSHSQKFTILKSS